MQQIDINIYIILGDFLYLEEVWIRVNIQLQQQAWCYTNINLILAGVVATLKRGPMSLTDLKELHQ